MKWLCFVVFFIQLGCGYILAQSERITDPEADFINTSLVYQSVSQKDRIIRRDIDIYDNGSPVIFLAAIGGGGRRGTYWNAYVKTNENTYKRYEEVQFREDTFRSGLVPNYNPDGGILAYYPGKSGGDLVRFQFKGEQVEFEKLRSLHFGNEEDEQIFASIFQRKWSDPLPDEYFKDPPHKIIEVKEIIARSTASHKQEKRAGRNSSDTMPK